MCRMPMFYFHIRQGDVLVEDPDGSELADLNAALAEATYDIRDLIAERIKAGTIVEPWKVEVVDANGAVLADVLFHDVILGLIRR
jgi:hypothetical protein